MEKEYLPYTSLSKVMRFAILLLMFISHLAISASASVSRVQDLLSKRFSLSAKELPIKSLFSQLEKQTGVKFVYSSNQVNLSKKVTLNAKEEPLSKVLEQVLLPLNLTYEVSEKHIVIKRIQGELINSVNQNTVEAVESTTQTTSISQERIIKGRVKDATDAGLPGVNVLVKGTQTGTITDETGSFSLAVENSNSVLVFSFVGYNTQEVALAGQSVLDITLIEDAKALEELVVVGYGVQSKRNVTSSIASVGGKDLVNQPIQQVGQALQGKVAGVQIVQNSGAPGSSLTVRIRGAGSVNNSDPLYVIDGNLGANPSMIDPSQIESMEVLKSASASAIYGAQGANGVIIITTKKGASGKPVIQVNGYTGVQQVHRTLPVVNGRQYAELYNQALTNAGKEPLFKDVNSLGVGTDWQNEIFRTASISNLDISASGGSSKGSFFTSAGYYSQQGTVIDSDYKRISFRINSEYKLSPKVKIGENLSLMSGLRNHIPEFGQRDIIPNSWYMDPTVPVKNPDGSWGYPNFSDTRNPVAQIYYNNNTTRNYLMNGSGYLVADLLKGLVFRTQLNLNVGYSRQVNYTPIYDVFPLQRNLVSTLENTISQSLNWDWQNTLNYHAYFGDHTLETLVGITALSNRSESFYGQGQNLPDNADIDENLRYLALATSGFSTRGSAGEYGMLSYLGRVNYSFKDKYLLTANLRVDGSSRFGANNRYGVFPSFSAGWRLSDEAFLQDVSFINDLKLKAGWGMLGNQNSLSNYAFSNNLTTNLVYAFGNSIFPGQASTSIGNPNLKWESIKETEVGVDFAGFNNKLSLSAAYYIKNTSNMLLRAPIPNFTGITTAPFVNGGSVQNKGVELVVTYKNKLANGFRYEISGNIAKNQNKVTSLANSQAMMFSGTYSIAAVGLPIGSFYGYEMDGIFQNQSEIDNHAYQAAGTAPGDIRFKDINGDNVINQNDRTVIGNPWPNFNYGFSLNLNWKKFDLSSMFYGVSGNDVVANWKYFTQGSNFYNFDQEVLNAWNGEGTSNTIPRLNVNDANNNFRASSYFVESGAYLRLRNLQIGYSIFDNNSKKINKLRVYASAQNLFTITKYKGFDPEIGSPDSSFRIGVDEGYYPQPRVFTLGLNVSF